MHMNMTYRWKEYRTLTRPWPPFTAYQHAFQGLNEV